jgi:hypothetical protein
MNIVGEEPSCKKCKNIFKIWNNYKRGEKFDEKNIESVNEAISLFDQGLKHCQACMRIHKHKNTIDTIDSHFAQASTLWSKFDNLKEHYEKIRKEQILDKPVVIFNLKEGSECKSCYGFAELWHEYEKHKEEYSIKTLEGANRAILYLDKGIDYCNKCMTRHGHNRTLDMNNLYEKASEQWKQIDRLKDNIKWIINNKLNPDNPNSNFYTTYKKPHLVSTDHIGVGEPSSIEPKDEPEDEPEDEPSPIKLLIL